ncbi:MAG: hypothetical protein LLG00_10520 [Planctomycetaceae bacterium]|nr:hypothetical protein [Planctomycetaceae bacterium]
MERKDGKEQSKAPRLQPRGLEYSLAKKRGRTPLLDEGKQREIAAIISLGCSQTAAARYVGCAPSTIIRTAERDPAFAERLGRAKCNAEMGLVKNIRDAANKEQYWRAAAWALERFFPDAYSQNRTNLITADQLTQVLTGFAAMIVEEVPVDRYRKSIAKAMESLLQGLGEHLGKETLASPSAIPAVVDQDNSAKASR